MISQQRPQVLLPSANTWRESHPGTNRNCWSKAQTRDLPGRTQCDMLKVSDEGACAELDPLLCRTKSNAPSAICLRGKWPEIGKPAVSKIVTCAPRPW